LQVDIFRLNEIDLWNAILLNPEACILKARRAHFILISCFIQTFLFLYPEPVLRIRICRIHMFLGLPDPDPLVGDMDPDPSIIKQK
jgi:hypothetical protein